jgi:hypothetical protein
MLFALLATFFPMVRYNFTVWAWTLSMPRRPSCSSLLDWILQQHPQPSDLCIFQQVCCPLIDVETRQTLHKSFLKMQKSQVSIEFLAKFSWFTNCSSLFEFKIHKRKTFHSLETFVKTLRKVIHEFVLTSSCFKVSNLQNFKTWILFSSTETSETHSRTHFNQCFRASSRNRFTMRMFIMYSECLDDKVIMQMNGRSSWLWQFLFLLSLI